jgi:NAD(P)-dependent dehydrogenase (short-subunit alcohol dehydrogenase family)
MSEKLLDGRVAIVTGSASGIGRASAMAFAREGATVVVSDISVDRGEQVAAEIRKSKGQAMFVPCDTSKSGEVEHLVETTIKTYGRLDCAVNNAGIEGDLGSTVECSEENWARTIGINLSGVFYCMKHELRHMRAQKRGTIVNIASIVGYIAFPGLPAYTASKHGVVGLTKAAALENAELGIRVNAVCPGIINTAMLDRVKGQAPNIEAQFLAGEPMGRVGTPEEVAEAVVWLCTDRSSFVTGHAMLVDGGWVAR